MKPEKPSPVKSTLGDPDEAAAFKARTGFSLDQPLNYRSLGISSTEAAKAKMQQETAMAELKAMKDRLGLP